jgi:hypothetical protein
MIAICTAVQRYCTAQQGASNAVFVVFFKKFVSLAMAYYYL